MIVQQVIVGLIYQCKKMILYIKLKSSGLRLQVLADFSNMIINVSNSKLYGISFHRGIILNMKIYNIMTKRDIVSVNSGYILFVKQSEE